MLYAFYGRISVGKILLLFLLLLCWALYSDTRVRCEKLKKAFCDFLLVVLDGMQAGYSLENSLLHSGKELSAMWGEDSDILKEVRALEQRVCMHQDIPRYFRDWKERSGIEEIGIFAELIEITQSTGGNVVHVIKNEIRVLRRKMELQADVQAIIAADLFQQRVMNYMPIGILLYVQLVSKSYIESLYHTTFGRVYMTVFLGIYGGTVLLSHYLQRGET